MAKKVLIDEETVNKDGVNNNDDDDDDDFVPVKKKVKPSKRTKKWKRISAFESDDSDD
jgi:hypothetical protein